MIRLEDTTDVKTVALPDENPMSRRYLRMIEKWIPTGVEYFADWPVRPNCGHFFGGCHWYGNETIGPAETFALASLSPEYNEKATGVSREQLQEMAVKAIRYLCFTHDTGPEDCVRPEKGLGRIETCNNKWGERGLGYFRESQCGTTISAIAQTCLLLRDRIDDETWLMVARIHEDYAARFADMPPRNGIYVDTQMEENAWTANGLTSCFLFLSRHEKAAAYEAAAKKWMFSTCSAPQDAKDHGTVGDSTARQLAFKTFTALPDYWAENHGMVHPNYTGSGVRSLLIAGVQLKLWGKDLPPELFWNRQRVYENLKALTDGAGYAQAVQGMDWHYLISAGSEVPHALAAVFFNDPDAAALQHVGLRNVELRQDGNNGRMYDKDFALKAHDQQDPMIMREINIRSIAQTYLLHRLLGAGPDPTPHAELEKRLHGVRTYPHAGFVHHRHPHGQTSLSWRNSIMALPLTREGIYTIGPCSDTFLGTPVVLGNPDSHRLKSIKIAEQDNSFAAAMIMDRCQETLRQFVLFASLPDGRMLSYEQFIAQKEITLTSLDQGFLRITNEHFPHYAQHNNGNCRGVRTLYNSTGSIHYNGWIGESETDDILTDLNRPTWLNIDDRIGIRFQGTGHAMYHNRHYYKPYRAIADDLTLSRTRSEKNLSVGQEAGHLSALLVLEQSHADTPASALVVPTHSDNSICLITDQYLTAANFSSVHQHCSFSLPASENIPVFPGASLDVQNHQCTYHIPLEAGSACLLTATRSLRITGQVHVDAFIDGALYVTNTGSEKAHVKMLTGKGSKRTHAISPGRVKNLI